MGLYTFYFCYARMQCTLDKNIISVDVKEIQDIQNSTLKSLNEHRSAN